MADANPSHLLCVCLLPLILAVYMQVDIVDFNGSFLARVRDFAGANPIILVITKVILLHTACIFVFQD
jgi:hypothetical protein